MLNAVSTPARHPPIVTRRSALSLLVIAALTTAALARGPQPLVVTVLDSEPADLALHALAYMDARGSAASNFDPAYMARIDAIRADASGDALRTRMATLAPAFGRDDRLWLLSIAPIYYESVESFLTALRVWAGVDDAVLAQLSPRERDVTAGLGPRLLGLQPQLNTFREALEAEHEAFYARYWCDSRPTFDDGREHFTRLLDDEAEGFLDHHFGEGRYSEIRIYLSEAMRGFGRGFTFLRPDHIGAIVPTPVDGAALPPFMRAVHELTHHLADPLVTHFMGAEVAHRSPNAADAAGRAVHDVYENAVIQANYWMFGGRYEGWREPYLRLLSSLFGTPMTDAQALVTTFALPGDLADAIAQRFGAP
jgi:hypothetical protein